MVDRLMLVNSEDGALAFLVRRDGRGVYVERVQHLSAHKRVSHVMRFDNQEAFVLAYEVDDLRFKYPHAYWRLNKAVEEIFEQ
jgi:hypothetical protein